MQLFILRHGHAEPQQSTDEARNLTPKGRIQVTTNCLASLADLRSLESVWISPYVRAQQTAHIVIDILAQNGCVPMQTTTDLITPDANPVLLFDELLHARATSILLVSHQPLVGQVIDLLCGKAYGTHMMDTGSLACLDCELPAAGLARLRWLRHVND
jgi:phosphohistidine phosphatase